MGLGVPVKLFVFFTEKSGFGKNGKTKKQKKKKKSKMAQKWDYSTILKNFVVNFCLKH